jgi:mRNA interferase RelE/StbE
VKTIVFTHDAAKSFDRLPEDVKDRILDGLVDYAVNGRGDVEKLRDRPGYRLRIGRFRVIFDEDQVTILALEIVKRDTQTYRRR